MRFTLPAFCQLSKDDVKFKPLKRLPFGPNSVIHRMDYEPPEPPPPSDFYPRKPPHWVLRGTPANTTRMAIVWGVTIYGTLAMVFFVVTAHGSFDRWFKRISGMEVPSLDQQEAREVEKRMRYMHLERSPDIEDGARPIREVADAWKISSGRFSGKAANWQVGSQGDPETDDL